MSTQDVAEKSLSIEPTFRNDDFLKRKNLSIRTRTRKSQINESEMQSKKRDYCLNVMISYCNSVGNPKYLLNMDKTDVYLNCAPNRTVHPKREKIVSIMFG